MAARRSVRIPRRSLRVGGGTMDRADLVTTIQGATASTVFSSFVSANATPDADGTNTNLTFTLKDTNDDPMPGRSVTYA